MDFAEGDLPNSTVMDVSPRDGREGILLAFENQQPGVLSQSSVDDHRDRVLHDLRGILDLSARRHRFRVVRLVKGSLGRRMWLPTPARRQGDRLDDRCMCRKADNLCRHGSKRFWMGSMEGAIRAGEQAARAAIHHLRDLSGP